MKINYDYDLQWSIYKQDANPLSGKLSCNNSCSTYRIQIILI